MVTIFKYPLEVTDSQRVTLPAGAVFLSVQKQYSALQLWALVDTEAPKVEREILIFGTGHKIDREGKSLLYISSVQDLSGVLVWHIFENA